MNESGLYIPDWGSNAILLYFGLNWMAIHTKAEDFSISCTNTHIYHNNKTSKRHQLCFWYQLNGEKKTGFFCLLPLVYVDLLVFLTETHVNNERTVNVTCCVSCPIAIPSIRMSVHKKSSHIYLCWLGLKKKCALYSIVLIIERENSETPRFSHRKRRPTHLNVGFGSWEGKSKLNDTVTVKALPQSDAFNNARYFI